MGTKHIGVMTFTFQGHVTSSVTWPFDSHGPISYTQSIVIKSLSPAISEIMGTKHIGVMTLTFQGHVTSSVTWPLDSLWSISCWWSFGPKSLSLMVSEIFRPKHHVLIDTKLNRHCACAYHVTCAPYVKFKYIFQFRTPTLLFHSATFIELRWRIRGVLSVTSNVKRQIDRQISKNLRNFDLFYGAWRSGTIKSSDFYCKRHILAWMHVVWAILRECPLRGLTSGLWGKKSESHARLP